MNPVNNPYKTKFVTKLLEFKNPNKPYEDIVKSALSKYIASNA